jgi:hypothetical protein
MLAVFALYLLAKIVLISWLVWDRTQQRRRDEEREAAQRERDGEFYHTIRDALAPVVGRLVLLEALTKQSATEIKHDVQATPDATANKVVDALAASDSGVLKTIPPQTGGS